MESCPLLPRIKTGLIWGTTLTIGTGRPFGVRRYQNVLNAELWGILEGVKLFNNSNRGRNLVIQTDSKEACEEIMKDHPEKHNRSMLFLPSLFTEKKA